MCRGSTFFHTVFWFGAASFVTLEAEAQLTPGSTQVTLDGTLFSFRSLSLSPESGSPQEDPMSPMPDVEVEDQGTKIVTFGVLGPRAGIGVGYAPTEFLLFGLRTHVAVEKQTFDNVPDTEVSTRTISAALRFEYVAPSPVAPYAAPLIGVASTSSESGGVTISGLTGVLGAEFGMHGFVTPSVSFDPALSVAYQIGSMDIANTSFDTSGFSIGLTFGISAWLGGSPAVESEPVEYAPDGTSSGDDGSEAPTDDVSDPFLERSFESGTSTVTLGARLDEASTPSLRIRLGGTLYHCPELAIRLGGKSWATKIIRANVDEEAKTTEISAEIPIKVLEAIGGGSSRLEVSACMRTFSWNARDRAEIRDFADALVVGRRRNGIAPEEASVAEREPPRPAENTESEVSEPEGAEEEGEGAPDGADSADTEAPSE